jgi:hypothetical protein
MLSSTQSIAIQTTPCRLHRHTLSRRIEERSCVSISVGVTTLAMKQAPSFAAELIQTLIRHKTAIPSRRF